MIELTIYPPPTSSFRGPVITLRTPTVRGYRAFLDLHLHPAMICVLAGIDRSRRLR